MKTLLISMFFGFIIVNVIVAMMTFDGILSGARLREDAKEFLTNIGAGYGIANFVLIVGYIVSRMFGFNF